MDSKKILQAIILVAALIPAYVGISGIVEGVANVMPGGQVAVDIDNEYRFLSGAFLGFAFMAVWVAPRIDQKATVWPFRLLCFGILAGAIGRIVSIAVVGKPSTSILLSLGIELTFPLLIFWQNALIKQNEAEG
ncbi:MAG: DUF4345 domain-containing protein [Bacteroidota bacterium]